MIVDSSHYRWALGTALASLLVGISYVAYASSLHGEPTGGTVMGLVYGIIGSLLMIYAGLFSAKKKLPRVRLGTARGWLKAHLWLGLLSVPFIFAHSAGRFGGVLEQILMIIFLLIIASGILGVALQHWLPRFMRTSVAAPGMYQQIPEITARLLAEADTLVTDSCGSLFDGIPNASNADSTGPRMLTGGEQLKRFYLDLVRPFLASQVGAKRAAAADRSMDSAAAAALKFSIAREAIAESSTSRPVPGAASAENPAADSAILLTHLDRLTAICTERRELAQQARMYRWLHGWLFIHIPLSCSLLILALAHIVTALYY